MSLSVLRMYLFFGIELYKIYIENLAILFMLMNISLVLRNPVQYVSYVVRTLLCFLCSTYPISVICPVDSLLKMANNTVLRGGYYPI